MEAGLGLNAAMLRVCEELKPVHPDISKEFELANLEIRVGRERSEALRNLADRTGVEDLNSLVGMLIQADRFGTSIARAVRVYSDSLRTKRRQRAEQAAQKAAFKLSAAAGRAAVSRRCSSSFLVRRCSTSLTCWAAASPFSSREDPMLKRSLIVFALTLVAGNKRGAHSSGAGRLNDARRSGDARCALAGRGR